MIEKEQLEKFREEYMKNGQNVIIQRILNKVPLTDLIQDDEIRKKEIFDIDIRTHGVTDQFSTGRCWAFAGLNLLREKVIEECELSNFELSAKYISFYDLLEKFNMSLEKLAKYHKETKDVYDKDVYKILKSGIYDGGFFIELANLIEKYGVVPYDVYPETFASNNTSELNELLSRLLRIFYLELQKTDLKDEELINEYLKKVYLILSNVYGVPPTKFDFEQIDIDGNHIVDKDITPKEFYNKYIGIDLVNDYVEISSYKDDKIDYYKLYEEEESTLLSGTDDYTTLIIPPDEIEELILKQLEDGEPVYFYAFLNNKNINGVWLDVIERFGNIFGMDLKMNCNDLLRTCGTNNIHCMLITGVKKEDDKIVKWKIENSWGSECGNSGYYTATNDWIKSYVGRVVINKKHLNKKHLSALKQKTIKLTKWDVLF